MSIARLIDRAESVQIDPRRLVIGVVTVPFWIVGLSAGLIVRTGLLVAGWMWAGLMVGFDAGRGK